MQAESDCGAGPFVERFAVERGGDGGDRTVEAHGALVAATEDFAPVGAEHHAAHALPVRAEGRFGPARRRLPDVDPAVRSAGDEMQPVGAGREAGDAPGLRSGDPAQRRARLPIG